jgi:hypothetical protein
MTICQNCGMAHEPDEPEKCIEGHGDDPIQVTIHGKYGRGPMPVEFRDALVEMVRLVKEGIDNGTIGKKAARPEPGAREVE